MEKDHQHMDLEEELLEWQKVFRGIWVLLDLLGGGGSGSANPRAGRTVVGGNGGNGTSFSGGCGGGPGVSEVNGIAGSEYGQTGGYAPIEISGYNRRNFRSRKPS